MTTAPGARNLTFRDRPHPREPTVAAGYVRALMDIAVAKGAPRAALVLRSGIDPARL
jgi:hypothetical protein